MSEGNTRTGQRFPSWQTEKYPKAEWVGVAWYYANVNAWMAAAQLYDGITPLPYVQIQEPRKRHLTAVAALKVANDIAEKLSEDDLQQRAGA